MFTSRAACMRAVQGLGGAVCLAIGLGACGGNEGAAWRSTNDCVALEGGELATLDADAHVLGSDLALGSAAVSLSRALLPDGGDVYWYDSRGALFVERQGNGQVIELRPAEPPSETHHEAGLGLAANADRLFVGFGLRTNNAVDYLPLEYDPPGRLLSFSKQDGALEVLLEVAAHWVAPIFADAERVIVFAAGYASDGTYGTGFYQVPLAAPRLEPLSVAASSSGSSVPAVSQASYSGGQLVGDQVYWVNADYPRRLLRAGFDDAEPEVLRQVPDDYIFSAGPDYVLTQEYVVAPDHQSSRQDFVVRDDTSCRSLPGPRGGTVLSTALDAKYAYWSGGNGSWIDSTPPTAVDLTRIDLDTGTSTRLDTPGFTPTSYLWLVGHDDTRLFLYSDGVLASARKP